MDSVLEAALRKFISDEHIRNVLTGEWVNLYDNHGRQLLGIRGRIGVSAEATCKTEIGLDLMEMQPGSCFATHTHSGDHVIYIVSGSGLGRVDGRDIRLKAGDSIFIPAELPHGFECPASAVEPLVFVAVGHPHKHLASVDRMKLVEGAEGDRSDH